jgi:flagellar biosynthesis repressor protein FlbT
MALALTLKPGERMILGKAVLRNAGSRSASLLVETPVPVLRQRDVLPESKAQTPCARIYLIVQLLYIDPASRDALHPVFVQAIREVFEAAPSLGPVLERISVAVARGSYYRALRESHGLLAQEEKLLSAVEAEPSNRQSGSIGANKLSRRSVEIQASSQP